MAKYSPLDRLAIAAICIAGVVEAINAAMADAPAITERYPVLKLTGVWDFVPAAFIAVALILWMPTMIRRLSPMARAILGFLAMLAGFLLGLRGRSRPGAAPGTQLIAVSFGVCIVALQVGLMSSSLGIGGSGHGSPANLIHSSWPLPQFPSVAILRHSGFGSHSTKLVSVPDRTSSEPDQIWRGVDTYLPPCCQSTPRIQGYIGRTVLDDTPPDEFDTAPCNCDSASTDKPAFDISGEPCDCDGAKRPSAVAHKANAHDQFAASREATKVYDFSDPVEFREFSDPTDVGSTFRKVL